MSFSSFYLIRRYYLILLLGLGPFLLFTQPWCGSSNLNSSPSVAQAVFPKTAITIPVVVHVVYFNEEERLSEAQINSQIEVLNEDFRALNNDLEDVIFWYSDKFADLEINFELASQDPQGNPHSGIIYQPTSNSSIGNSFTEQRRDLCYDEQGGSTAWCTDCYLNIWVADLGLDGVAGIGIFPTDVSSGEVPRAEDGVYIQYNRFGRGGSTTPPYHLGRTCTHEVGHYLNLLHPWGNVTPAPGCSPAVCCPNPDFDDLVEDTGKQIRTYVGECPGGVLDSCPGGGELLAPDNYQNFMGFADDACAIMFTQGQKERVWTALQEYRMGLLNTDCVVSICLVDTNEPSAAPSFFQLNTLNAGYLSATALETDLDWRLYDAQGRLLNQWHSNITGAIFSKLPDHAGLYFLSARKGKQIQIEKMLLIK